MYEACLVVPHDADVALEIPAVAKLFLTTLPATQPLGGGRRL